MKDLNGFDVISECPNCKNLTETANEYREIAERWRLSAVRLHCVLQKTIEKQTTLAEYIRDNIYGDGDVTGKG